MRRPLRSNRDLQAEPASVPSLKCVVAALSSLPVRALRIGLTQVVSTLRGNAVRLKKIAILLVILYPITGMAAEVALSAPRIYQIDMFSLISFGLAITALFLATFMGWLSWEFYKKSTEASDKTSETVTRVETLVSGIQSNISEIVQRAVSYWIESGGGNGEIDQSKLEVYEKLNELEQLIQTGGNGNTENLLKEVSALKTQMDELSRGIRESQIKTLFPNIVDDTPTLKYEQQKTRSDQSEETGVLRISVLRPTRIATAPLKFDVSFKAPPELMATLVSSPYDDASTISAKPGTPTMRGANIHLNNATPLKPGLYVFEYLARER